MEQGALGKQRAAVSDANFFNRGASSSVFTGRLTSAHAPGLQAKLLPSAMLRMDTEAPNTE